MKMRMLFLLTVLISAMTQPELPRPNPGLEFLGLVPLPTSKAWEAHVKTLETELGFKTQSLEPGSRNFKRNLDWH